MIEFLNKNLRRPNPEYFYRVLIFVTTFGADKDKNEPYIHEEEFKGSDLTKCKTEAEEYFKKSLLGLVREGKYFLPFEKPHMFTEHKHAAFSITLALVEYYSEDEQEEYFLRGEDRETMNEGIIKEYWVLERFRLN